MTYPHLKNLTWYVYRHFDSEGRALYVGCSHDLVTRYKSHLHAHTWWAERIARTDVSEHKGYKAGRSEEVRSIGELLPLHNHEFHLMNATDWDRSHFLAYGYAQMECPWAENFTPTTALGKACRHYQDRFGSSLIDDIGPVPSGYRRNSPSPKAGKKRVVRPNRLVGKKVAS